jgi:RNA polymerase-binding transcription factor DksA
MDTEHFKKLLEKELAKLEEELATVGRKNPDNASDWEAKGEASDDTAEEGDLAETIETFEDNRGIVDQLEKQYSDVKKALEKMAAGAYGTCEVCGGAIEEDRLEANPAATTCKQHMN